jgi:hypothetical protein
MAAEKHRKEIQQMISTAHVLVFFLMACWPQASLAGETAIYSNQKYGFSFVYPKESAVKTFGETDFDVLKARKVILSGIVQDEVFRIFLRENGGRPDLFQAFARERVKTTCAADGPDGSRYCDEIITEKEFRTESGLQVFEFYLRMISEEFSKN